MGLLTFSWADRKDLDSILQIERATFAAPMSRELLEAWASRQVKRESAIIAAHSGNQLTGYAITSRERQPTPSIVIYRLAVRPDLRGRGIGSCLIERLLDKLNPRYPQAYYLLESGNLTGCRFLSNRGFKPYLIDDDDYYLFVYRLYDLIQLDDCEQGKHYYFTHRNGTRRVGTFIDYDFPHYILIQEHPTFYSRIRIKSLQRIERAKR